MKLSYPINTVNWNGTYVTRLEPESYLPVCRILKEVEIDELMISGYVTIEEGDFDMTEETKRLGGLLDSMGMRPAQHHGLSATYAPIGKPQEPVVEKLIRSLHYTANMNSPVLVIHPGQYDEPESWKKQISAEKFFEQECAEHGLEAVMETVTANLREAGKEAERLGIKIAMENVDRFAPMGGAALLEKLVQRTGSPAVGYCLDTGHAHCCGRTTPTEWIAIMGKKLFTTHVHDNRGPRLHALSDEPYITPSEIDEHMSPGFGTIPWIDVIRKLREIGYSYTLNFESGPWQEMPEKEGYEAAIRFWRTCEKLADKK